MNMHTCIAKGGDQTIRWTRRTDKASGQCTIVKDGSIVSENICSHLQQLRLYHALHPEQQTTTEWQVILNVISMIRKRAQVNLDYWQNLLACNAKNAGSNHVWGDLELRSKLCNSASIPMLTSIVTRRIPGRCLHEDKPHHHQFITTEQRLIVWSFVVQAECKLLLDAKDSFKPKRRKVPLIGGWRANRRSYLNLQNNGLFRIVYGLNFQ